MAITQYPAPGFSRNEFFEDQRPSEIDSATLHRVDEIVDTYPPFAVSQALENANKQNTLNAFDQMLLEHPELYTLISDMEQSVVVDAELSRASAKPDVLKPSLKERAFGIFLEKPEFGIRLVNAESELGGKMFGNE